MSWNDDERRDLLERLERDFLAEVARRQTALRTDVLALLSGLDLDGDMIKSTVRNVRMRGRLMRLLDRVGGNERRGLVKWLVDAVKRIVRANRDYFSRMLPGRNFDRTEAAILASLGYAAGKLTEGSYLYQLTRMTTVRRAVLGRFTSAVLSGTQQLGGLLSAMRRLLTGAKGLLRRFFSRPADELFVRIDRETQTYLSGKAGLVYAVYAGTRMARTREFCAERYGRVYTRAEIERWQRFEWNGKIPDSDVKVTLGGYRCRHILSWVTEAIAIAMAGGRENIDTYRTAAA